MIGRATSVRGPKVWNNIPNHIMNLSLIQVFKKKLRKKKILKNEAKITLSFIMCNTCHIFIFSHIIFYLLFHLKSFYEEEAVKW